MLSLDFKKFNNDSIKGQYWSLRKRLDAAFLTQSLQSLHKVVTFSLLIS